MSNKKGLEPSLDELLAKRKQLENSLDHNEMSIVERFVGLVNLMSLDNKIRKASLETH